MAFAPDLRAYAAAADAAAGAEDPWEGFGGFVRAVCAIQAADPGFADVLARAHPAGEHPDPRLRAAAAQIDDVVRRAKAQRFLRGDFEIADVGLLLAANAGVVNATRGVAPAAWERFAGLMLDAFSAGGSVPRP